MGAPAITASCIISICVPAWMALMVQLAWSEWMLLVRITSLIKFINLNTGSLRLGVDIYFFSAGKMHVWINKP